MHRGGRCGGGESTQWVCSPRCLLTPPCCSPSCLPLALPPHRPVRLCHQLRVRESGIIDYASWRQVRWGREYTVDVLPTALMGRVVVRVREDACGSRTFVQQGNNTVIRIRYGTPYRFHATPINWRHLLPTIIFLG
ncbi:unnamed protein product [Closterium sp. NIES-54]